jgi:TonB family protein
MCTGLAVVTASISGNAQNGVTAGSLIWLVHQRPTEAHGLIGAALADPEPNVRLAAARLVGARQLASLDTALARALGGESNPTVAAEQVRAAMLVGTPASSAAVASHLTTAETPALRAYMAFLARTAPERLVREMPSLLTRLTTLGTIHAAIDIVAVAAYRHPQHLGPLLDSWLMHAPDDTVRTVLRSFPFSLDEPAHMAAIESLASSASGEVRRHAVWQVFQWLTDGRRLPPALVGSLAKLENRIVDEPGPLWERLGREMLVRLRTGSRTGDRSEVLGKAGRDRPDDLAVLLRSSVLTDSERRVARAMAGDTLPADSLDSGPWLNAWPETTMRTVTTLAPSLFDDLFREAGCQPSPDIRPMAVHVRFRQDGRVAEVDFDPGGADAACAEVLKAVSNTMLAEDTEVVSSRAPLVVLLPLKREWLDCARSGATDLWQGQASLRSVSIRNPRRTGGSAPRYPANAQQPRIGGAVTLTGVLARTGCMHQIAVTRSVDVSLDLAAITAVLDWRYTPLLLDGTPTAVQMTITVRFQPR